jgi:DNA-binding MurR/RpiR family transcriptional regulator
MSASRLARHLSLDVATVTRFTQQIGYEGYVEFIREIQETVLEEMREARAPLTDRFEAAQDPFTLTLWRDWANLEKTIQHVDPADARLAVEAIASARRVYLVSEGVGAGLCQAIGSYLNMRKEDVRVLSQGAFDMALAFKDLTADDLVIGVGFTNYSYAATRALEVGRKTGAKTIGVIAQANCPIGPVAEILFACSATQEGYLPSPTGVGAILFALTYTYLTMDSGRYHQDLITFQEKYADLTEGTMRGEEEVVDDLIGRF